MINKSKESVHCLQSNGAKKASIAFSQMKRKKRPLPPVILDPDLLEVFNF